MPFEIQLQSLTKCKTLINDLKTKKMESDIIEVESKNINNKKKKKKN